MTTPINLGYPSTKPCGVNVALVSVPSARCLTVLWFPGESVELVEYEGSAAGLIRSFAERFPDDAAQVEADLLELSKRDAPCWC